MAAKQFEYICTKVVGTIGNPADAHKTIEIGHYVVDGKVNADKVYIIDHFFKRDGSMDSKATSLCKLSDAAKIGELLVSIR